MGIVLDFKPRLVQPAVSEACRWNEAFESIAAGNLRIMCPWQRTVFRFMWGL